MKIYSSTFRNYEDWNKEVERPNYIFSIFLVVLLINTGITYSQTFGPKQTNPFSLVTLVSFNGNKPALVDIDGDGDNDIFSGASGGNFDYYENVGGVTLPSFSSAQFNPFLLSDVGFNSSPTFGDLDNDGDFDLISGDFNGNFHYFENTGTPTSPNFGTVQTNPFSLSAQNPRSEPSLADLDNDGDLDLMTGDAAGNFHYFENIGNSTTPVFSAAQTNPFSLTSLSNGIGNYSSPELVDIDNDGDFDLLSGGLFGEFYYFENIGTSSNPSFSFLQINPFSLTNVGDESSPSFCDIDNDGDLDLLSGELSGNFYFFENQTAVGVDHFETPQFKYYPNPTEDYLHITSNLGTDNLQISVFDHQGRIIYRQSLFQENEILVQTSHWKKGIYHFQVVQNQKTFSFSTVKY